MAQTLISSMLAALGIDARRGAGQKPSDKQAIVGGPQVMQGRVSQNVVRPGVQSPPPLRVSGRGVLEIARKPIASALGRSAELIEDVIPRQRSERLARSLNLGIAVLAAIILSPVFILVALAVKLTSPGPVFYSQVRVGVDRRYRSTSTYDRRGYDHGGAPFMMFKFRTMQVNAEADGRAVWAVKSDPRITSIGKFLRKTRLDELPQLLNVIRGDMNIVGPRPERPTIFADLRRNIPNYSVRQRVKPGITGWAQINQAYDSNIEDVRRKVELDLEYMKRQSVAHDLQIMTMTLPVMIFRRGSR